MDELKPCPFCGKAPTPDFSVIDGEAAYHFHCQNAECPAWPNVSGETEEDAITAWNTRSPVTDEMVEMAVKALEPFAKAAMDKAALLALADRVEAGDVSLTAAQICVALQYVGPETKNALNVRFAPDEDEWLEFEINDNGKIIECCDLTPGLLTSIDAAMALVPEGGFGSLVAGKFPDGSIGYVAVVTRPNRAEGTANRAALAITAAALRATAGGEDA